MKKEAKASFLFGKTQSRKRFLRYGRNNNDGNQE